MDQQKLTDTQWRRTHGLAVAAVGDALVELETTDHPYAADFVALALAQVRTLLADAPAGVAADGPDDARDPRAALAETLRDLYRAAVEPRTRRQSLAQAAHYLAGTLELLQRT